MNTTTGLMYQMAKIASVNGWSEMYEKDIQKQHLLSQTIFTSIHVSRLLCLHLYLEKESYAMGIILSKDEEQD